MTYWKYLTGWWEHGAIGLIRQKVLIQSSIKAYAEITVLVFKITQGSVVFVAIGLSKNFESSPQTSHTFGALAVISPHKEARFLAFHAPQASLL